MHMVSNAQPNVPKYLPMTFIIVVILTCHHSRPPECQSLTYYHLEWVEGGLHKIELYLFVYLHWVF